MGISWSSNRRRNNYLQNRPPPPPPPPPQLLSSSYYYPSEPSSLPPAPSLPPPPPPNPQLLPPHNYAFTSNPPYPPPPYPPHNLYPAHPPPIHSSPYYYSAPYNYCNYGNPMMGRSNYQPFYANHSNYWTQIRPPVAAPLFQQQPLLHPPPYVEHQNAKKVRNDVNVHKNTLRLEVDERNPDLFLVSFTFDALFGGSITIYYFAKEESNCRFSPLFPDAFMPVTIPFQKGLGQKFRQPSGTGIDLGFFELDDLSKPSPGEDVFPLVISAETSSLPHPTDEHIGDATPCTSPHMQITQAVLEKNNEDPFQVRVIRQILWVNEVRYELREIYGIASSAAEGFKDNESGKECVICMTEPKDTAVLPCRHMCMCSECAKELRLQSNKCPICRQPIEELIEIKINNSDQ